MHRWGWTGIGGIAVAATGVAIWWAAGIRTPMPGSIEAPAPGPERGPAVADPIGSGDPPARRPPREPDAAPGSGEASGEREAARELLAGRLALVVERELPQRDLERLADLLLVARDAKRADEPEAIAREIELLVAAEFERIAGEPLGSVASRLSLPWDNAPRPPRRPEP